MSENNLNVKENQKTLFTSLKEENEDNIIENKSQNNPNPEKGEEELSNIEPVEYRLNYSFLLEYINSPENQREDQNEFFCNILLVPYEIDTKNKLSTLYNLQKIYNKTVQKDLFLVINKKLEKILLNQKDIKIKYLINSFSKSANFYLELNQSYFYSLKYINKCTTIINDSKNLISESDSKHITKDLKFITQTILDYIQLKRTFFENSLNIEYINKIATLIDLIMTDQNNKNIDESNDDKKYLYIINKVWIINLLSFIKPYQLHLSNEGKDKEKFFDHGFDFKYISDEYIKEKENQIDSQVFPGPINNLQITSLKDYWKDDLNLDENDFIKKKAEYALVNYDDWNFLSTIFGFTNIIRRKKDNLDLISFKTIIFDRRIKLKNKNINLLKERYIQINKAINIKQFKEKILRCADAILKPNDKEKEICFFILDKEKSNLLIEMTYSYISLVPIYESLYIKKIEFKDEESVNNLFNFFDKKKHILIVEIIEKDSMNYFVQIEQLNYKCTTCFKKLKEQKDIYKCPLCNYSVFCSQRCANNSEYHRKIDEKMKGIMEQKFRLSDIFSDKYNNLLLSGNKGRTNIRIDSYDESFFIGVHCLSNTLSLTKYFLSGGYKQEQQSGKDNTVSNYYGKIIKGLWEAGSKVITPDIQNYSKQIDLLNTNNVDAYIFINNLLRRLDEELSRNSNVKNINNVDKMNDKEDNKKIEEQKQDANIKQGNETSTNTDKSKNSIITDLFLGQYKEVNTCINCGNENITFPYFLNIDIPLPDRKTNVQIKLLTNNLRYYYVNIKLNENTEMRDILLKSFEYLNLNKYKYIKYLLTTKIEEGIINYNINQIPDNILYNNLQFIEINKDFQIVNIYETSYNNIKKDKTNNNNKENFDTLKYKDYIERKNISELVIFEKDINSLKPDYITIYVYPLAEIEKESMFMFSGIKKYPKILSYPVLLSINKKASLVELNTLIFNKFKKALMDQFMNQPDSINIFYPHFNNTWENLKIKERKCPICQKLYTKENFGCNLFESFDKTMTIENLMEKQGKERPLILYAKTDVYDPRKEIYKDMDLFVEKNNDIENKETVSLYDALDCFNNFKVIEGENYFCKICNLNRQFKRKICLYKLPLYLIIKIDRHILQGKNDKFIEYKEIMDLKDYVLDPKKANTIYDLYAVLLHKKSVGGSYYYSYCKSYGFWINYNLEGFAKIDNPISKDAYMLFYKRRDVD